MEALGFQMESENDNGQLKLDLAELSPDEKKVYELLKVEPFTRDDLVRALGLSTSATNSLLGIMEIKGYIKEAGGEIRLG